MTISSLWALALATMLLGLSPGPAVFATMARSLKDGLLSAYIFIAGIVAGDFLFALLAMAGLAQLAASYQIVFLVLKLAGGAYLIYLAVKSWRAAARMELETAAPEKGWRLFISGFLLTCGNPKDLLFFVGFLPLFIDLQRAGFADMALASAVITATFILTLSLYAVAVERVRAWFEKDAAIRWLHRIAAIMMAGVGVAVIFT